MGAANLGNRELLFFREAAHLERAAEINEYNISNPSTNSLSSKWSRLFG